MKDNSRERLAAMLGRAMPVERPALENDLWPRMLRRMDEAPRRTPWLDWILLAGGAAWCAVFPRALSALLYQL